MVNNHLQEVSIDARSKLSRALSVRTEHIHALANVCSAYGTKTRRIMTSCAAVTHDMLLNIQHVTKMRSLSEHAIQLRYFLESTAIRTQYLSLCARQRITFHFVEVRGAHTVAKGALRLKLLGAGQGTAR